MNRAEHAPDPLAQTFIALYHQHRVGTLQLDFAVTKLDRIALRSPDGRPQDNIAIESVLPAREQDLPFTLLPNLVDLVGVKKVVVVVNKMVR